MADEQRTSTDAEIARDLADHEHEVARNRDGVVETILAELEHRTSL